VTDLAWIEAALIAARPRALGALVRYFRDLDIAEEAFQNASLKALETWPRNGPPREPASWLIMVARNTALDSVRRAKKQTELPDEAAISNVELDATSDLAERLDGAHYRDDVLRLLFICCHPELPATQQIALALRIISGLTVPQIARAFLVSETAMEQRITRAKKIVANAEVPFETPGPAERHERLGVVAAMIYLVFNEGYSTRSDQPDRARLCDEAIRLARLLLRLFPDEPELLGLMALMLLQHSRSPARLADDGTIILLEDQDRSRWSPALIGEGLALIDKAMRHRTPGPYQVQAAIAALHARAEHPGDTDWTQIDLLYANLERLSPSPVVTLNRAVAFAKVHGPAAALAMVEPLDRALGAYFHFHGVRGALLQQLGRAPEAAAAFSQAIALATSPAEAAHIRDHLDRLKIDMVDVEPGRARSSSRKGDKP
jgi:RNA polymerase sigma-70 factor, ECF subfamily